MDPLRSKSYPRALPFRSPDEIEADAERRQDEMRDRLDDLTMQAGHLRRCTHALGVALIGAVVLVVALTVYLLQPPTPDVTAQASTEPAATLAPSPPPRPVLSPPTRPAETPHSDTALEAMGGLSAANLYQSYLTIGLLADGVQNKAFTIEGATTTLKIVASCLTLVDDNLAKLDQRNLDAQDVASLRQIKAVAALMRIQAQALETYWSTGKAEHGEAYRKARTATWTGLSKVLGMEGG
jgi:hypothetical protein